MNIYESKDYKRARNAYIGQCTFEYLVAILVSDAYLATLLSHMGISDGVVGIISSLVSFAFLFQLIAIFIAKRIKNVKNVVTVSNCFSLICFMGLYVTPFLPVSRTVKTVLVISLILLAYLFSYSVSGILFKWANSFVESNKRAEYSATKEIVSLVSGIVFTFVIGMIIDKYAELNKVEAGFVFTGCAILILTICNFISLMLIKKDSVSLEEERKDEKEITFRNMLKNTLGNKSFVSIVIFTILFDMSRYMTIGFMGIYKTKDLMMSVGLVQIINILGYGVRAFISRPFGRYSDKTSYAKGIRFALIILATAFAIGAFTTPKTWWLIIVYTILFTASVAGTNQNSSNMVYSYVNRKYFVQAMAIKNSIGGICGFLTTLVASKILGGIQKNNNTFLGIHMYGQQVLSTISVILLVITIFYLYFVVEKQKVKKQ